MSDPTRFDLDERQRAMLAEMGVRVWWPLRKEDAAPAAAMPATVRTESRPDPRPDPVVLAQSTVAVQPRTDGVAQMDWPLLQNTVEACQACDLCGQRKKSVFGVGDLHADWLVVGDPQAEAEGQHGEPFVGPANQLLDNMLKAVGLSRQARGEGGVYITSSLKCRLPDSRNPSPQELATCAPYLARQIALVQPKVIVVMGRFAVQSVLQSSEPLGKLRGQVHQYLGVPVVVTYHPNALLRNLSDKAKAWVDLLLALQVSRR
jgi:DNA polymerase